MEKEISSGTMLGIVLIALAAVIGLGFGVFAIAKGVASEGVVNVQDNLEAVSDSAYTDFDQKVVTGIQVTSAYKTFEGKPVAILINTQAMKKGVKTSIDHQKVYVHTLGTDKYVNYNAVLSADAAGALPTAVTGGNAIGTSGTTGVITLASGVVTTANGFSINASGKVVYDTSIAGISKAGNCEYISSSAKFDANLIKDASGETIGIIFTQLAQ